MRARTAILISVVSSLVTLLAMMVLLLGTRPAIADTKPDDPEQAATVQPAGGPEGADPNAGSAQFPAVPEDTDLPAATHYVHVSGSTFRPLWSSGTTIYAGSGCVYMGGTNAFLNASIELPYNSVVSQLRMYWKDSSASNGTMWLAQYDDGLAYTYVVTMTTSGTGGWGTTTANFTKTLDYVNYSYTVLWSPSGVLNSNMQLCGYRLAYTPPLGGLGLLPAILYNHSQP